jgi:glycosyltransferase involved in cell wall biosynthesis
VAISFEMKQFSLRVLIVRDRLSAGGGIFNYYNVIRGYLRLGVIFVDVGRPQRFYGVSQSLSTRFTLLRLVRDWLALAFNIIRFRPDIVHVNPGLDAVNLRSLRRDAVNVWIARFLRRRVLVFWRGWNNAWCGKPEFPGGNSSLLCRTYQRADAHIVLAKAFEQDLRCWGFKDPIFVETTVASQDIIDRAPAHRSGRSKPVHLLFLSRVEVEKGVFELLEAFLVLQQRSPHGFTLTIAGNGPELGCLQDTVTKRGLRNISFTGLVEGEKKIDCYREASIFCFLSYTEGMPNAVLEAMAMGLPIVSSDAGGLRDILCEGKTGFIIQPVKGAPPRQRFKPVEVADAIERLARDPELYERISAHNAAYARDRFAAPKVAKRLEAIYRSVLGETLDEAGSPAAPAELVSSTESARL